MNSLNASSASVISHWNVQKHLLQNKIDKKQIRNSEGIEGSNIFNNINKTNFFNEFNANMGRSIDMYKTFINSIIHK
jgi:hypothetical protein